MAKKLMRQNVLGFTPAFRLTGEVRRRIGVAGASLTVRAKTSAALASSARQHLPLQRDDDLDEMSDEVVRAVNEMFAPRGEVEVLDEF